MLLYFLRHGKAGRRTEWSGPDSERSLTEEGVVLLEREALNLAALFAAPDLILTSPLVRASQTAAITARGYGAPRQVVMEELLAPGFGRKQLGKILNEHSNAATLMLVGHEPDFSLTAAALIGGARIVFGKGDFVVVSLPIPGVLEGMLVAHIPARVLAGLGAELPQTG